MTTLHVDAAQLESRGEGVPDGRRRSASTRTSRTGCGSRSPSARRRCSSTRGGQQVAGRRRRHPADRRGGLRRATTCPCSSVDEAATAGRRSREPRSTRRSSLGAAPEPLRPLIDKIGYTDEFGVEVTLRGGIPVRFGNGPSAAEKWAAAAAVLADPKLDDALLPRCSGPRAARGRRRGLGQRSIEPPAT